MALKKMNAVEALILLIFCSVCIGISCFMFSLCCSKQNVMAPQAPVNFVNNNESTDSGIYV